MRKAQDGLKMNKESHLIKKSSSVNKAQQRRPVIIYTHSPKVIQTHARYFMDLVQKLTGLYRVESDPEDAFKPQTPQRKEELNANKAVSPEEEVESSCCNCMAPLIPDYNNIHNYAVFESDFNMPLLTFPDPSFFE